MITQELAKKTQRRSSIEIVLLVLGIILIASNLRAPITSVGPLIGVIVKDTGISHALAGMLTSIPLLSFAVCSLLAPRISRRFGMENTLFASLVVLTTGIVLRSLPSMAALFIGTAVLGLAIAVGNVLLPSLIKREFPTRVGLLTGVYSMCMNIWAAIASGVSVPIAHGLGLGWRGALICWAILSVISIAAYFPVFRLRYHPSHDSRARDGYLWYSKIAWQVTLFLGLQATGFYATVSWLPQILQERGMSVETAGWMLSLMQLVAIPISFIVPLLAGRLPNQKVLVIATLFVFLIGYIGLLSGGSTFVTLWIILIGLGQGTGFSLSLTLIGLRTSNAHQAAELSGMAQSIGYLLAAVVPVLFGFIHDLTHDWSVTLFILIVVSVVQLFVGIGAGRSVFITPKQEEGKIGYKTANHT